MANKEIMERFKLMINTKNSSTARQNFRASHRPKFYTAARVIYQLLISCAKVFRTFIGKLKTWLPKTTKLP